MIKKTLVPDILFQLIERLLTEIDDQNETINALYKDRMSLKNQLLKSQSEQEETGRYKNVNSKKV